MGLQDRDYHREKYQKIQFEDILKNKAKFAQKADNGWLASINDHAKFFAVNRRYRLAMTGKRSGEDFARQIALAGYATDPRYAEKVVALIRQHGLDQFDEAI